MKRLRGVDHELAGQKKRRDPSAHDDPYPEAGSRTLSHSDYTVGWICALPLEMTAAIAMLDEIHSDLGGLRSNDHNTYKLSSICGHNVVIACLPSGVYGTTSAAIVADHMLFSFRSITLPLMAGIGGGVPSKEHDIRLGDVVVGIPTSECPAVVQYDYGKTVASGKFEQKGTLNKPTAMLLTAVSKHRAHHDLISSQIPAICSRVLITYPLMKDYARPNLDEDVLSNPDTTMSKKDRLAKPVVYQN